ncbi:MAG: HAMP domain-containing sensor histidine kinase [Ideonella sp.]|nr:HAMP domain-containing sensor histidine kinase [Ideonella sp.]
MSQEISPPRRAQAAFRSLWPSITFKVLLVTFVCMVASWFLVLYLAYHNASSPAQFFDYSGARWALLKHAEVLREHPSLMEQAIQTLDDHVEATWKDKNQDPSDPGDRLCLQLFDGAKLVFATKGLPADLHQFSAPWSTPRVLQSEHGRWWQVCEQSADHRFTACALDRYRGTWEIARYVFGSDFVLWPAVLTLIVLFIPMLLALWWGLRPLKRLATGIETSGAGSMAALPLNKVPVELRALAGAVSKWSHEHQRSTAREREFVANAAHELRTPLAAIQVNAEGLQQLMLPDRAQGQLQSLMSGVRRMSRVVEQLMTMLRNDGHTALGEARGPLRLDVLLQMRLAELSSLSDRKSVTLHLVRHEACTVNGIREVLESIVDNLVNNAIKYSAPGQEVTVSLHRDAGQALLVVRDHGPGISDALKAQVFERFQRGQAHGQIGVGLGLSIVRDGVTDMNGTVALSDPEDGQGLRVTVTLPLTVRSSDNPPDA